MLSTPHASWTACSTRSLPVLNREAAVSIIDLRIDPEIQARVEVLAERANEGTLTPDERAEYLSYVEAADLLTILKLKAKRHLEANGSK